MEAVPEDLLEHLVRSSRLGRPEAARLVAEVVAYFDEAPEAYVVRRHAELQAGGLRNPAIFERLTEELRERRFSAPGYSARQLRRIVYG